jgi:RNA polymerase sigma-70 factor (ECF subfamily)
MERRVPTDAVEDVIQETILSAWSNVSQFDETRSFKLWLLGIAQNKSRDFWRKNFGRNETLEDWELFEGNSYLQLDFEDVELSQVLAGAWSELTPSMREVLELYYGQELKLPEISLLLNTNLNTIKHRFYRAHAMLAENFDAESIQALMKPRSQNTRHGEHGHIRRGR